MTNRRAEVALEPPRAYERICVVLASMGEVESANPTTGSIVGKARYGLNPVRLRISVLSGQAPGTALVEIAARGQDIWGAASRKVIDRLLDAI